MTSRAMKAGAIEFLMKPFQKDELLAAIRHGLDRDRVRREQEAELSVLQGKCCATHPARARGDGFRRHRAYQQGNRSPIGLSEVTVKIYRSRVMQKMEVASLAELVRMADKLKPRT